MDVVSRDVEAGVGDARGHPLLLFHAPTTQGSVAPQMGTKKVSGSPACATAAAIAASTAAAPGRLIEGTPTTMIGAADPARSVRKVASTAACTAAGA